MLNKIFEIIRWVFLVFILGIIIISFAILVVTFSRVPKQEPEPLKEVFFISLEQFPDGSYYLQYSIDGYVQHLGFHDWERYIEFTNHLRTMYSVNEYKSVFQHGIDNVDLSTGSRK